MSASDKTGAIANSTKASAVDAFLDKAKAVPAVAARRGRLVFALDATMSRQPTWDLALSLQGKMFDVAASHGGLDVQLCYFRGFAECKASRFVSGGEGLADLMSRIDVRGGTTQIEKVLNHVRGEAKALPVGALIFVGDACEEHLADLKPIAGELGLLGVKAFMFQEGRDADVKHAFQTLARLTGGAYAAFDASAPAKLAGLMKAAAAYAAGGRAALEREAKSEHDAAHLLSQMK